MNQIPNFLYIGTSKAGSTWLYDVLNRHPDVYMAPGKGLYFFSYHYERGLDWYLSHFSGACGERALGEISHSYMYAPEACERIAALNPKMRLLVCLRDPTERAFSDHLDAVKNGRVDCSFEAHLARNPQLVEWGRYARHLAPYVACFGRERLHVAVFEELNANPDAFARSIFSFLKVTAVPLAAGQRQRMQPAGKPRSRSVAQLVKKASHAARALGLRRLRGRVKTSRFVRSLLYRPYAAEERPVMSPEERERLRALFRPEVEELDHLLGTRFLEHWGYR